MAERVFSAEQAAYIQELAVNLGSREIAVQCNKRFGTSFTAQQVRSLCVRRKFFGGRRCYGRTLPVGSEYIARCGIYIKTSDNPTTWRLKHHIIWELIHGPIPEGGVIAFIDGNACNFNPENLALRYKKLHLYSERNTKDGYIVIKAGMPSIWQFKHHFIWESIYGPIPDGHHIIFGDGDKSNLAPDNLILVSPEEHAGLKHVVTKRVDPDLTRAALQVVRVRQAVKSRKKKTASTT